ncbi:MAG TPA: PQQ-binding-like beta-propeller repeat protein [Caulobacterales bacterium]|nr:PQQ-binding-like beta-propeller repeat protein [Caulobacterales bacterium]
MLILALTALALSACGPQHQREYRGWGAYGGGPEHIQYSSLDQINAGNVRGLGVAWTYDTGEDPNAGTMHSTPLLADGVLYVAGPTGAVHALNPANGQRLWRTETSTENSGNSYWRGAPRGLMYWRASDASGARRIFTLTGRYIVAIDAATGAIDTRFGHEGRVDLHENLGRDPASMDAEMSSPGVIFKDLLIIGSRVGEQMPTAPGHIRAYDVRTGALRWIFHTIPYPGEAGYETWPRDAWTYAGGANSWSGMSLDEQRGIVFLATGSAASDFYGADRPGDNLYANCVLALNAETGALVWRQQLVRHDLWDRDAPAPPILATLRHEGRRVDAVIQTTKSGHVWVFNRDTGASLFPIEEVAAPPSMIPGEHAAPTQRVPTRPLPFMRQTFTADDLTDRTPAAHAAAVAAFSQLEPHGAWAPPSLRGRIMWPGFDGGAEWGGGAFDPATGVLYVNANEVPWILRLVENRGRGELRRASDVYRAYCASCHGGDRGGSGEFPSLIGVGERRTRAEIVGQISGGGGRMPAFASALRSDVITALADYLASGRNGAIRAASIPPQPYDTRFRNDGYPKFLDPDGYPASKPPWGTLTAINLNTGEQVWRRPLGQYPELVAQGLADTGSENYGGPVVTAGGLVFIAATLHDRKIRAFDKATGELLWEHELPAAGVATPAVYEAEGREFVVIAAGGPRAQGMRRGATYIAFALPLR